MSQTELQAHALKYV